MPPTPSFDPRSILRVLTARRVRFIVVGGVGAALQGAPVATLDLDVVHAMDEENVGRLLGALEELDAYYRIQPERRLRPQRSHLASGGHRLLTTRFGELDVLGRIGAGRGYDDLLAHSHDIEAGEGLRVRVLDLEAIIATKEESAGEKDRAMLPVLRRTLDERNRR